MSSDTLRIALNAASFPLLYRDAQRAVVLKGLDQSIPAYYQGVSDSQDWNQPALLFCENVMPIAKGYISTKLSPVVAAFDPPSTAFDQAIVLRDANENNTLLVPAGGQNYLLNATASSWATSLPFTATKKLVTRAYTQGRSFVFYEKEKLFEYDGTTHALVDKSATIVMPGGYTLADIRGIGGASNYLLLFTAIEILWSSPTDPLNFNSALNNGSGRQIPQDLRGAISCILPVSGGAIVYSVRNAVAAMYTNSASTPFIWKGISNSGGVAGYEQVAYDADEKVQYVWGSGGLQQVSLQSAEAVFPEISDFLTSSIYETYDYTNHVVLSQQLGSFLSVKLTYVAQRFLVISYGVTIGAFTYALIYDTAFKRWGKIKVTHTDSFTYPYPNLTGDLAYSELNVDYTGLGDATYTTLGAGVLSTAPPKRSIAFLGQDGTIQILSIDYRLRTDQAVAIFGQIQHNRNYMTTLHNVELEGVDATSSPHVYGMLSINGKDIGSITEILCFESSEMYRKHLGRITAKNLQVAVIGAFNLTGLLFRVSRHGSSK